jgi:hypothetical protein
MNAALIALPVALAVDLVMVVVLRRGLSMGRDASIGVALVVTVAAWAIATKLIDAAARWRASRTAPPRV